jgi:hypothetical protein
LGGLSGSAPGNGVIGGGKDTLQIAGAAFRAHHFHFILLVHDQDFHKFVAILAFEFIYGHRLLLIKIFLKIDYVRCIVKPSLINPARRFSDGVVKSSRSRLRIPRKEAYINVLRTDEG